MENQSRTYVLDNELQRAMNRRLKIEAIAAVIVGILGVITGVIHLLTK